MKAQTLQSIVDRFASDNVFSIPSNSFNSSKQMFLKILQNLQENVCARVSFIVKLQAASNFIKKETPADFPMNFAEIVRTPFITEHPQTTASVL